MALLGGSLFITEWKLCTVVNRQSLEPQSAKQYGIMNTYKIIGSNHKMQFICVYMATSIHQVQHAHIRELHGNATTYLGLSKIDVHLVPLICLEQSKILSSPIASPTSSPIATLM